MLEAREINPDLRALAFLNAADPQGRDNVREAQEALREVTATESLDLIVLMRRKAFPNAAARARVIIKRRPRGAKGINDG